VPGGVVRVGVRGLGAGEQAALAMVGSDGLRPLTIADRREGADSESSWLDVVVPAEAGLYGLEFTVANARHRLDRCLAVPRDCGGAFSFVHMSDSHIMKGGGGKIVDRTRQVRRSIELVSDLRPDFVIHTGDLITRYDENKEPVSEDFIYRQMRQAAEMFAALRAPLFMLAGNHETAYPATRDAWAECMGEPYHGGSDDYSFDFGGMHFAILDRQCSYDPTTDEKISDGLASGQGRWLAEDMAAAARASRRLLFTHYDYDGSVAPLVEELGIDAVFYGHSAKRCFPLAPLVDGHLADGRAWRVVRVRGDEVTSELGLRLMEL